MNRVREIRERVEAQQLREQDMIYLLNEVQRLREALQSIVGEGFFSSDQQHWMAYKRIAGRALEPERGCSVTSKAPDVERFR
ncbi:hypothetical protein WMW72_16575 [Paenibacillus filicis]|uniref:Uncharacterized protein n=1 Tax=Paenibacillus filicis TaxID=669464 RepID=A0ABU9DMV5_9BACL